MVEQGTHKPLDVSSNLTLATKIWPPSVERLRWLTASSGGYSVNTEYLFVIIPCINILLV
jgi:hypothetical protein